MSRTPVVVLRRLVLAVALMVWQGGFMFYGGVVVPIGADVFGSHRVQGFVTQRVTDHLNVAGAVALAAWAWDTAAGRGSRRRWAVWGVLAALLAAQAAVHLRMDDLLVADGFRILDGPGYRRLHQGYLLVSTIQWATALGLLGWTLAAWRVEDAARRGDGTS